MELVFYHVTPRGRNPDSNLGKVREYRCVLAYPCFSDHHSRPTPILDRHSPGDARETPRPSEAV